MMRLSLARVRRGNTPDVLVLFAPLIPILALIFLLLAERFERGLDD
jgi:hypothetical protein